MAVAAVGAGDARRQALAGELGDGARGEVEQDGVGARQLGQRAHRAAGLDRPAVLADRRPASAAAIACEPPRATGQPWLWPAAISTMPTAELSGAESGLKECAATPPNSARASALGSARASSVAGLSARRPKPASASGWRGRCWTGRRMSSPSASKRRDGGTEESLPGGAGGAQAAGGRLDRALHRNRATAVQRVRQVDLRPGPLEPVALEVRARGRRARRRPSGARPSSRRAAARAGSARWFACRRRSSGRPRSPSPPPRPSPAPRRRRARSGPAPTTIALAHAGLAGPGARAADSSGWTGKGRPSSQGWRSIMSATFTQPSSTRPEAASKMR